MRTNDPYNRGVLTGGHTGKFYCFVHENSTDAQYFKRNVMSQFEELGHDHLN